MDSSVSEESSTESLSIPKLLQVVESSLREYENAQTNMLEKLKMERDSSNQEVVSLKNTHGVMKLKLLELQDELRTSEALNKKNEEEQKNQQDKLKELYEKVCVENSIMTIQRSKLVSDVEKNKQLVGVYRDKSDLFGKRLEEMEVEKLKLEEKLSRSEMNCTEQTVRITGLIEEEKNFKKRFEDLYKENETKKQKICELEQQLEKYQSLNGRVKKLEKEIDGMMHEKLATQTKEFGEERFHGGCDGQQGSAPESRRKRRLVLDYGGGGDSGVLVRAMLSSPSASQDIIPVCKNDETNLCNKNGTVSWLLPSNQKTKPDRTGKRGNSVTNLTAKRRNIGRNICRSAETKFPTGEKVSESLESTHDRIGSPKKGSILKAHFGCSPATLPSKRCAEKARLSGIVNTDSMDVEDESCSSSHMNEIIDNLRSKICGGR